MITVMNSLPAMHSGHTSPDLAARFARVRERTLQLAAPLAPEDTVVQSMPDASPVKWHLAHTTWFFEQFVLSRIPSWQPLHPEWRYLFNSYYQSVGPMHTRAQRGLLSRPTLEQVLSFRKRVDDAVIEHLQHREDDAELAMLVTLGLHHEQQHQELLLTDVKHLFSINPLQPAYAELDVRRRQKAPALEFIEGDNGIVEIGHSGQGFAYDNEMPRHRELLHGHAIANRPASNAEFREFIEDGGYRTPTLWMSEGWETVQCEQWQRPLYWSEDLQSEFTLAGLREIDPHAPVCHVSFFEADAYARWAGARLPLEAEWEHLAAAQTAVEGNFQDGGLLHPCSSSGSGAGRVSQLFGDVWEWTSSPYVGYPGFHPLPGALGEYNGKFMCGQWVLRGGSCATPADHFRISYRNFFYPASRWQFMGFRLGKDT